jgi:hypothetical protein
MDVDYALSCETVGQICQVFDKSVLFALKTTLLTKKKQQKEKNLSI